MTQNKTKRTLDLYCDTVSAEPRHFDFSSGYGESWDTVYPDVSDWTEKKCCDWLDDNGYDDEGGNPRETVREKMTESEIYCPMMNYIYPLPDLKHTPEKAQELIEHTNCVVVLIDGEPFMALSGGGMDLSWDICEAYMLLGYLPPLHFCELPDFAGKQLTETAKWIIDGCRKSCEVSMQQGKRLLERLDNTEKYLKQNTKKD